MESFTVGPPVGLVYGPSLTLIEFVLAEYTDAPSSHSFKLSAHTQAPARSAYRPLKKPPIFVTISCCWDGDPICAKVKQTGELNQWYLTLHPEA